MTDDRPEESVQETWLKERRRFNEMLLEPMVRGAYLHAFQDEKTERHWGHELFELSRQPVGTKENHDTLSLGPMEKIAETVHRTQRTVLQALNAEGACFSDYPAYLTRISHDADKVRLAGCDEWVGFVCFGVQF